MVGVSWRKAPLELRERVACPRDAQLAWMAAIRTLPGIREALLLSTCNRVEIYAACDPGAAANFALLAFLADRAGLDARRLAEVADERSGADCVRHLYRVASALESQIVGESQILAQMKDACRLARTAGARAATLERLFLRAIKVGRRARARTAVSRAAVSVGTVAVRYAAGALGTLEDRRVLVLGTGNVGSLVVARLSAEGARIVVVAGRQPAHAVELARRSGADAAGFEELSRRLPEADILICSTGAPGFVVRPEAFGEHAAAGSPPLLVLDLSVPRNVDPAVGRRLGVRLFTLDDLSAVAEENRRQRAEAAREAQQIVEEELARDLAAGGTARAPLAA